MELRLDSPVVMVSLLTIRLPREVQLSPLPVSTSLSLLGSTLSMNSPDQVRTITSSTSGINIRMLQLHFNCLLTVLSDCFDLVAVILF